MGCFIFMMSALWLRIIQPTFIFKLIEFSYFEILLYGKICSVPFIKGNLIDHEYWNSAFHCTWSPGHVTLTESTWTPHVLENAFANACTTAESWPDRVWESGLWIPPFVFDFLCVTVSVQSGSSCPVCPHPLWTSVTLTATVSSEGVPPAHPCDGCV